MKSSEWLGSLQRFSCICGLRQVYDHAICECEPSQMHQIQFKASCSADGLEKRRCNTWIPGRSAQESNDAFAAAIATPEVLGWNVSFDHMHLL